MVLQGCDRCSMEGWDCFYQIEHHRDWAKFTRNCETLQAIVACLRTNPSCCAGFHYKEDVKMRLKEMEDNLTVLEISCDWTDPC